MYGKCSECEHVATKPDEFPCRSCMRAHLDMFKPKKEIQRGDICKWLDDNSEILITCTYKQLGVWMFDGLLKTGRACTGGYVGYLTKVGHTDCLDAWLKEE